jgi:hypothetical protein
LECPGFALEADKRRNCAQRALQAPSKIPFKTLWKSTSPTPAQLAALADSLQKTVCRQTLRNEIPAEEQLALSCPHLHLTFGTDLELGTRPPPRIEVAKSTVAKKS